MKSQIKKAERMVYVQNENQSPVMATPPEQYEKSLKSMRYKDVKEYIELDEQVWICASHRCPGDWKTSLWDAWDASFVYFSTTVSSEV